MSPVTRMCLPSLFVAILIINRVQADVPCLLLPKGEMSCRNLNIELLNQNLSVIPNNDDIQKVKFVNSSIYNIQSRYFKKYKFMKSLTISNSNVFDIDKGAFADFLYMRTLNLNENYLEKFSSNYFGVNTLTNLDLSDNLLKDLSQFNITHFPSIKVINLTNNALEYLPGDLLEMLKSNAKLYLIVQGNPWNCSHPEWVEYLDSNLINAFCATNTYNATVIEERQNLKLQSETKIRAESIGIENKTNDSDHKYESFFGLICSWKYCLFWSIGGIWIGVIIGNACKIKRLLFSRSKSYADKNTQCERDRMEILLRV